MFQTTEPHRPGQGKGFKSVCLQTVRGQCMSGKTEDPAAPQIRSEIKLCQVKEEEEIKGENFRNWFFNLEYRHVI